jgi:hypothetical protein
VRVRHRATPVRANPLSLLRWAGIPSQSLIEALRSGFEGVGTPGQTELAVSEAAGEYFIVDRRFRIESHTFTLASQVESGKFLDQQCQRLLTTPLFFLPPVPCADSRRFPSRSGDFVDECASWGWKRRNCATSDG